MDRMNSYQISILKEGLRRILKSPISSDKIQRDKTQKEPITK